MATRKVSFGSPNFEKMEKAIKDGHLIRILPPKDGWYRAHHMHWMLPAQAKPNAQGNYVGAPVAAAMAPGIIGPALTKGPSSVTKKSSLRMPEVGDRVAIRGLKCDKGTITHVGLVSASGGFTTQQRPDEGSCMKPTIKWDDVEDFHRNLTVLAAAPSKPVIDRKKYPSDCKLCGSPCYNGFTSIDCSNASCTANRGFVR